MNRILSAQLTSGQLPWNSRPLSCSHSFNPRRLVTTSNCNKLNIRHLITLRDSTLLNMESVRRFLVARVGFKLKTAVENSCSKLHIDTSSCLEIVAGSVSGSADCRRCPTTLPAWFDVRVDDEFPILVGTAKDISRRRCRDGGGEGDACEEKSKEGGEKSGRLVVVLLVSSRKG